MTTALIRVLVADDDDLMRSALEALVQCEPSLELVGSVSDAPGAIAAIEAQRPDVALIDVRMPGGGGLAVARAVKRMGLATRMLVLSAEDDRATVLALLEAGAVGYLVKSSPIETIAEHIRRAAAGQSVLASEVAGGVFAELSGHLQARRRQGSQLQRAEARVRRSLDQEGAIEMVFQPIYRIGLGDVVGVEALARFRGPPDRPPDWWFDEAVKVGLGAELERAAAEKALEALRQLPADCYLSINVSPKTAITAAFRRLIEKSSPDRIVIEITEHAPIGDYDRLNEGIGTLRSNGVRLAIDDAGAGFASLRHILRLDPDFIKLDRALVSGVERDRPLQALTVGLIAFADKIGATIIAEGIERRGELVALDQLGVGCGQGFYLGRPGLLPLKRLQRHRARTTPSAA